jgi:ABC-type dipeptide/oligopeptide/nickel transport system permease subunit
MSVATDLELEIASPATGPWWLTQRRRQLRRLFHHRTAMIGVVILGAVVAAALLAPLVAPYDPLQIGPHPLQGPSWAHPFGTDDLGRDVLTRVLYGARISPVVGVVPVLIGMFTGIVLGLTSGYLTGIADNVIMRLIDVLLAFPGLVLAIAVVAILGPGLVNAMIAVGIAYIPIFARVVRGMVLVEKQRDYIKASRLLGARTPRILFIELLPNVMGPVMVLATLSIATSILAAAALSFIGLGAQLPTPEWGAMLSQGRNYLPNQWWMATFPGIAIALTVLGINLLGDGLREIFDPRL